MTGIERTAPDTIRFDRSLGAPIETVWRWLVEPELRARWFAGGAIEPRAGGGLTLVFDHDSLSSDPVPYPPEYAEHKGVTAQEEIVAFEPPHVFALSWAGGTEGVVRFELRAEGPGSLLMLTHSGLSGPASMLDVAGGWLSHLAVLEAKLAGGSVSDFWALHRESQARAAAALE